MVLRAYGIGIFPMASHRSDPSVHWVAPTMRGILPLATFHMPRRLRRRLDDGSLDVRCDTAFAAVIAACAEPRDGHPETWINAQIARVFCELHERGHAHSVEVWRDGELVGGLYGLALGGAFFGESMFSRRTDASKIALVHLVARLRLGGFALLDIQFVTSHLQQFGAIELPAASYLQQLDRALRCKARFYCDPPAEELAGALGALATQSSTHRS
ncbi:MAG: leucyl/phenylalanyl-tRNA--protein transferase [Rhodospirillales bacterium]